MDPATWGVAAMLPGLVAALSSNRKVKLLGLAASALVAVAATVGVFR